MQKITLQIKMKIEFKIFPVIPGLDLKNLEV